MSLSFAQPILLVGDSAQTLRHALAKAAPAAPVRQVADVFEAIAELTSGTYDTVLLATEPIAHRAEAAVRTLRQLIDGRRLLLFGDAASEPLARGLLKVGVDDYLLTPPNAAEVAELLGARSSRWSQEPRDEEYAAHTPPPPAGKRLGELPLADIMLDSLLQHPADAMKQAVSRIDQLLSPAMRLRLAGAKDATASELEHVFPLQDGSQLLGELRLEAAEEQDGATIRHFLADLANMLLRLWTLQQRHQQLQKLAITDELTGVANGRYFRHFLTRILDKARAMRFPVTLLLFDIDNFKKYNEQYGHGMGDQVLKQTAALMQRCCRDHDLVARLSGGGDEFAVIFWEKEGPRQPRDAQAVAPPPRTPQTPLQMLQRFGRLLATQQFSPLGVEGRGELTISGGLAVFPYDASDVNGLIEAADKQLVFGAKRSGKNSIHLVGGQSLQLGEQGPSEA